MTDYINQNRETYNTIAKHFSGTREYIWDDLKPLKAFAKDGDRILDVGCGNGRLYQMFQDLSIAYTGVDQSEGLITLAREKFPAGQFVVAEMTELPFPDQSFSIVYCIAAFQHMPTRVTRLKALSEMKRVLAPGGHIILTNWNLFSKTASARHPQFAPGDFIIPWKSGTTGEVLAERYYHGFTLSELEELFSASELHIVEQYYSWKGEKSNQEEATNIVSVIKR